MNTFGRDLFLILLFVASVYLLANWMAPDDGLCYEMRRLTESDTFIVCGDAVETYLESGCCHVLGREER